MSAKLTWKWGLFLIIAVLIGCGGLRFSQVSPEAKNFHPKSVVVFPVEVVGNNEEARGSVEHIVAGVLAEKKWFSDIVDAESLNRQLTANAELRTAMTDYLSKLRQLNFSDPDLSKKIGALTKADSFLLVSVDTWAYTVEKGDKVAKVSLGMKFYDAATGKEMWKANHQISDSYMLIKPDLPKVARKVADTMVDYMPHDDKK